MCLSEPKPKIIYRNLEDIIKGSIQNKPKPVTSHHTHHTPQKSRLKTTSSIENPPVRNSSRHSLHSKEKIKLNETLRGSLKKDLSSSKRTSDGDYNNYRLRVETIYSQMESILRECKQSFIQKTVKDVSSYEANLQKMQKMSRDIKQLFGLYLKPDKKASIPCQNKRILTEITQSNDSLMSKLSVQQQKKRKANRLKGFQENLRQPSVYELALLKKH